MEKEEINNKYLFSNYFTQDELKYLQNTDEKILKLNDIKTTELNIIKVITTFINIVNKIDFSKNLNLFSFNAIETLLKIQKELIETQNNIEKIEKTNIQYDNEKDKLNYEIEKIINENKTEDNINNIKETIKNNNKNLNNKYEEIINIDNNIQNKFIKLKDIITKILINSKELPKDNINNQNNNTKINILENNNILIISDKDKKILFPYKKHELELYSENFPEEYKSTLDVIEKRYIESLTPFVATPKSSRFHETYSLMYDRESNSQFTSFKYALSLTFDNRINPIMIAACKTQKQLENYLTHLNNNTLNEFNDFVTKYEITPLNTNKKHKHKRKHRQN